MLALAALLAVVPAAGAFDSNPGGPHDDITRAAALAAGYPEPGIDALVEAVRAPDLRDSKLDPKATEVLAFDATAEYRPWHHCDRVPPEGDLAAFAATLAYVRQQRESASLASRAGDAEGAVAALGNALHAVEDCFSHSNAVDLPDPGAVVRAVNGIGPPSPPGDLRLVGFLPNTGDPEAPPGDAYGHGGFAKDSEQKNDEAKAVLPDGRTKFVAARDLAETAATLFLRSWVANATAPELQALGDLSASEGSAWGIPSAPAGSVALALVALAAARRPGRRPR